MSNDKNIFTGKAGEFFVAAELSRRKWYTALTFKNTPDIDILCSNGNKIVEIQCKSTNNLKTRKAWLLSKKSENWKGINKFYIFIDLNLFEMPIFYVLPSQLVCDNLKSGHQKWLNTPGKHGQKHKDQNMRIFPNKINDFNLDEFKNNWELLWK